MLILLALYKLLELPFEDKIHVKETLMQSLNSIMLSKKGHELSYAFSLPRLHLCCNHLLHIPSTSIDLIFCFKCHHVFNEVSLPILPTCYSLFIIQDAAQPHSFVFKFFLSFQLKCWFLFSISPYLLRLLDSYLREDGERLFPTEWHLSILRRITA